MASCNSNVNVKKVQIGPLYTAKRDADSFVVRFHQKADTVFLYYFFTFQDGNYLNYPTDSSDYAGFFLYSNIKNGKAILPVKDYRQFWNDSSKIYDLTLEFRSDTAVRWYIDSVRYGILDYLPHNIIFHKKRDSE
jgi:hypothetical protein